MRSETSFALDGDLIVIDAVVIGPSGRADIQLVLDTGAVLTTLVPTVAQAIGYGAATSIRPTVTRTAAADEHGYLVQLVELSTLGVTVPAVHQGGSDPEQAAERTCEATSGGSGSRSCRSVLLPG